MAEGSKKQNGSYLEVPLTETVNGDVGEQVPTEETKEQGIKQHSHLNRLIKQLQRLGGKKTNFQMIPNMR